MIDPKFRVEVYAKTEKPQTLIWGSAHQCVHSGAAIDDKHPGESSCGDYVVKHLLQGGRGHYSPLEAPQISFNVIGFPHSVMQQVTRHRIGIHFSVQSFRYTSQSILDVANGVQDPDDVFYFRPVGDYTDRQGKRYTYTESDRNNDLSFAKLSSVRYRDKIQKGFSEEHARGAILFDVRQNWVMSVNVRSLMHLLDLRSKANAQLEAQQLCDLIWPHFQDWVPEIANWYRENRWKKARLAP